MTDPDVQDLQQRVAALERDRLLLVTRLQEWALRVTEFLQAIESHFGPVPTPPRFDIPTR